VTEVERQGWAVQKPIEAAATAEEMSLAGEMTQPVITCIVNAYRMTVQ
jgi:hypothetical protein